MNDSSNATHAFSRYRTERSDAAFREVVTAYLPMVFGVALRLGNGDADEAEDVAQMVFADLVRQTNNLRDPAAVGAWLHRHTRFLMKNSIRQNVRRRNRELMSVESQVATAHIDEETSLLLAEKLDASLAAMTETDRRAIILRFYEGKAMREVGSALGIGEDAAQKRVSRALEKLRALLVDRRQQALSVAILGGWLTSQLIAEVPSRLAPSVTRQAMALAAVRRGPLTVAGSGIMKSSFRITALCGVLAALMWLFLHNTTGGVVGSGNPSDSGNRQGWSVASPVKQKADEIAPTQLDSIVSKLRMLIREPDTLANKSRIKELIATVPNEDLPTLAARIDATGIDGMLYRSVRWLLAQWGDADTPAAMKWMMDHVISGGFETYGNPPWVRAFKHWQPKDLGKLQSWIAEHAHTPWKPDELVTPDVLIFRRLITLIALKDPAGLETFLAQFPDCIMGSPGCISLHDLTRSRIQHPNPEDVVHPFAASPDQQTAELNAPTPSEFAALPAALLLPPDQSAASISELLQTWNRSGGAAPLDWAVAHLTPSSAASMVGEVIAAWAQRDPISLGAWYSEHKDFMFKSKLPCTDGGNYALPELIIYCMAANDPIAATEFLVRQCKTIEVQVSPDGYSPMTDFSRDIPAGLTTANQCQAVLDLVQGWKEEDLQQVQALRSATLAKWKLWDTKAANAWELHASELISH